MLHRKKRESILYWVQSAGGTDVESLKQLSDGIIHYQLIKTLLDKNDESLNETNTEDFEQGREINHREEQSEIDKNDESLNQTNTEDFEQGRENNHREEQSEIIEQTDTSVSCKKNEEKQNSEALNDQIKVESDESSNQIVDKTVSNSFGVHSLCESSIIDGTETDTCKTDEIIENSACKTIVNGHANESNDGVITEYSLTETNDNGYAKEMIENSACETDVKSLSAKIIGQTDVISEDSSCEAYVLRLQANAQKTLNSESGETISFTNDVPMELIDNVNLIKSEVNHDKIDSENHIARKQTIEKEHKLQKSSNYIDGTEDITRRYQVIQKFIENMLELNSVNLVNYKECQKGKELEIAKVTILLLSAMVQYSLSVNKEHVMATCYGLPAEDQEEIMDCLELFLSDKSSDVDKKEFNKRLARTARPRITPIKNTPSATPQRRSKARGSHSRRKSKDFFMKDTDSPIQKFLYSPGVRKFTPNSEARLLEALREKDKTIASLTGELDVEKYNADDFKKQNDELLSELSKSKKAIEKLKAELEDTLDRCDNLVLSSDRREKDFESEIKRRDKKILELLEVNKQLEKEIECFSNKTIQEDQSITQNLTCNCQQKIDNLVSALQAKDVENIKLNEENEELKKEVEFHRELADQKDKELKEKEFYRKKNSQEDVSEIQNVTCNCYLKINDPLLAQQFKGDENKEKEIKEMKDLTDKQEWEKNNADDTPSVEQDIIKKEKYLNTLDLTSKNQLQERCDELEKVLKEKILELDREKKESMTYKRLIAQLEVDEKNVFPTINNLPPNQSDVQVGKLWPLISEEQDTPKSPEISKRDLSKKSPSLEHEIVNVTKLVKNESKKCKTSSSSPIQDSESRQLRSGSFVCSCEKDFKEIRASVIELCDKITAKFFLKKNDIFLNFCQIKLIVNNVRSLYDLVKAIIDSFNVVLDFFPNSSGERSLFYVDKLDSAQLNQKEPSLIRLHFKKELSTQSTSEQGMKMLKNGATADDPLSRLISDLQSAKEELQKKLQSSETNIKKLNQQLGDSKKARNTLSKKLEISLNETKEWKKKCDLLKRQPSIQVASKVPCEKCLRYAESLSKYKTEISKLEKSIYYLKQELNSVTKENNSLKHQMEDLKKQRKKLEDDLDDQKRNNAGAFNPTMFKIAERLRYEDEFQDKKEGFYDEECQKPSNITNISAIPSFDSLNNRGNRRKYNAFCKAEDEAEMLSQSSIAEIFSDSPREREKEFRRRNTLYLPHLKSAYPLELNTTPSQEKYFMPPTPTTFSRKASFKASEDDRMHKKRKTESSSNSLAGIAPIATVDSRSSLKNQLGYSRADVNLPSSTPKESRNFPGKMFKTSSGFLRYRNLCKPHNSKQ